jgi:hypothetical protein
MAKFEIGKTYSTRSICDQNCIFSYTVIGRTAQTVKIADKFGKVKTCRIIKQLSEWNGSETIYPEGRYSMAPTISA